MTQFSIAAFLTFFTTFFLAIFVFFYNKKPKINKIFCLYSLSISWWSFFTAFHAMTDSQAFSFFAARAMHLTVPFIPILFFHFSLTILNLYKKYKNRLLIGYFISTAFVIASFTTPFIVPRVRAKLGYHYFMDGGFLYPFLVIIFFIYVLLSLNLLLRAYLSSVGNKRNQLKYLFWGSVLGYSFGVSNFFPVYDITIFPYPFGSYAIAIYVGIAAYAILRYRLMDIEVIIRETAVFAGIFGFAVGIFALVMHIGQTYLEQYMGQNPFLFPAIALFLVTIAVRPIEKLIYKTLGRFLFKKKEKYQQALKDAAEGMATIRKPERLLSLIARIVSKNLNCTNVAVYVFDDEKRIYTLRAARYISKVNRAINFSDEEVLIAFLKENRQPIVSEEVAHWLREEKDRAHKEVLTSDIERISEKLASLKASVCVPSFFHKDQLLGLLVLGDKISGDLYTSDDLELLNSLANEAAIAIRNSILYTKLQQKADEMSQLYQKEQRLFTHAAYAFANAIDARDPYTHGHSERVTEYALAIAEQMEDTHFGSPEKHKWFRQRLKLAGLLHDIGKIATPDRVLQKAGKLNDEEWMTMRAHPVVGAKVLNYVKGLWDIVPAVKHHHERYDGKGYPDKLEQEDIPFMARVLSVADTYDAMTSDRPYRKALSVEHSRLEINNNSATQFDPYVVGAFLKAYTKNKIAEIMKEYK